MAETKKLYIEMDLNYPVLRLFSKKLGREFFYKIVFGKKNKVYILICTTANSSIFIEFISNFPILDKYIYNNKNISKIRFETDLYNYIKIFDYIYNISIKNLIKIKKINNLQ